MKKMKVQISKLNKTALIIFIKNPELGKTKTRLAATVGDEEALRIYKLLLAHTRNTVLGVDADRHLFYSSYIAEDNWSNDDFTKHTQVNGDLGVKMRNAFSQLCKDYDKVLIVGSDCAQLKPTHIQNAIDILDTKDVVLGPVHDGGYYLLGMTNYYPQIITDITWSTAVVAQQTIDKASESNLSIDKITMLSDIDYYDDWVKYGLE